MSIRGIIWDFGGVLARTENPASRTQLAQRFGLTREALERLVFEGEWNNRATVGQIGSDELWLNVCAQLKLLPDQVAEFQQAFWAGDQLDAELVTYVRALRPQYRSALLSNAWSDLRQFLTEQLLIADAFDELIISAEVRLCKPDPRIFQLAVERLGVMPDEAVLIDDLEANIRAAAECGLHTIRFLNSHHVCAALEELLPES